MDHLPRLLMIIGSGELAPPMTRGQRTLVNRLAAVRGRAADVRAVVVDTPFGFQSNADALSASLVDHFARRLGMSTSLASYRRADDDLPAREAAFERIREADFVFSGPGSPSYALRQWTASTFPALLAEKLTAGGAVVFASAAALTLGRLTVPVYELYKVGADPYWLPGLDVMSAIGIRAAVIPHFDNAEGTGHDTRFCFLGEARLAVLEAEMPEDCFVLGVDEHTALMFDLDADTVAVYGRGGMTVRRGGISEFHPAGEELPLASLRNAGGQKTTILTAPRVAAGVESEPLARRLASLEERSAVSTRLAGLAPPLIEALLDVRHSARRNGDYEAADAIRDRLTALGIDITDAADGTSSYRMSDSDD